MAYISGVQPAVEDDSGCVVRAAEVAAHDVGSAEDNVTVHAGLDRGAVLVEDLDFLSGERDADGPGAPGACDGVDGGGAGSLGQPVALDERESSRPCHAIRSARRRVTD
jgi:hypothetical protein